MLPSRKEKTDIQKPSATDTGRRGVGSQKSGLISYLFDDTLDDVLVEGRSIIWRGRFSCMPKTQILDIENDMWVVTNGCIDFHHDSCRNATRTETVEKSKLNPSTV